MTCGSKTTMCLEVITLVGGINKKMKPATGRLEILGRIYLILYKTDSNGTFYSN